MPRGPSLRIIQELLYRGRNGFTVARLDRVVSNGLNAIGVIHRSTVTIYGQVLVSRGV